MNKYTYDGGGTYKIDDNLKVDLWKLEEPTYLQNLTPRLLGYKKLYSKDLYYNMRIYE